MTRLFDILVSSSIIILIFPLFILCALLLKLTGEGEIFYLQCRIGKDRREFKLIKFATMLKISPKIASGEITIQNDPRVLPVGKFLRKTKINEIPQLVNVLIGDMSLVGPRPMVPKSFEKYGEARDKISSVRPGLTGIGSLLFRDEERLLAGQSNPIEYYFSVIHPYKARLELWYINEFSIYLYFKIIVLTAISVLFVKVDMRRYFRNLPTPATPIFSD